MKHRTKMKTFHRNKYLEEYGGNLLFLNKLISIIRFIPNPKILEIGCGTGTLAHFLSQYANVIGIEKSKKRRFIANQKIQCFYSKKGIISEDLGPFDLIYCKDVLPSVKNKLWFYKSICDKLNRTGFFCTYLPNKNDIENKPLYRFTHPNISSVISPHGSIPDNIRLLYKAGFTKIKKVRIPLGSVWLNEKYVLKHIDGYFSTIKKLRKNKKRITGINKMSKYLNTLLDNGITLHYEYERVLLIANKNYDYK